MKAFHKFAAMSFVALSFASFDAAAAIDNAASVVLLRTSCDDGAGGTLNNCFTDMSAVTSWITNTRKPNDASPLAVNIGPGTFGAITLACNSAANFTGNISFVGAGREQTTIDHSQIPITISQCTKLSFSGMLIRNGFYGYIQWDGGGTSNWTNVEVQISPGAWNEGTCGATRGQHYWFGSRIVSGDSATATRGYAAKCDETWFIGSEISMDIDCINPDTGAFVGSPTEVGKAINATNQGIVHAYGSVIRSITSCQLRSGDYLVAAVASNGGSIHIHGTGIDVLSDDYPSGIVALSAGSGGEIHANSSAYNLSTAIGGTVTRVKGAGHVHAPYLWEHIPDTDGNPGTVDTNFTSANGADQTTVTVSTSDGHPHPAIYSATCPATARWYDTVDKLCRAQ